MLKLIFGDVRPALSEMLIFCIFSVFENLRPGPLFISNKGLPRQSNVTILIINVTIMMIKIKKVNHALIFEHFQVEITSL